MGRIEGLGKRVIGFADFNIANYLELPLALIIRFFSVHIQAEHAGHLSNDSESRQNDQD